MFGLFGSKTYDDPKLGTLTRSWRHWRVSIPLPVHGDVEVRVGGTRSRPHSDGLALVRELKDRYAELMPSIAESLYDHYEPYGTAGECEDARDEAVPQLGSSDEVWDHVKVDEILVEPLDGLIEIAYTTGWDIEHRLGARIREWRLCELNGSV